MPIQEIYIFSVIHMLAKFYTGLTDKHYLEQRISSWESDSTNIWYAVDLA